MKDKQLQDILTKLMDEIYKIAEQVELQEGKTTITHKDVKLKVIRELLTFLYEELEVLLK